MAAVRLGFVGAGNMAEALIRGLTEARVATPPEIIASDIAAERRTHMAASYGIRVSEENRAVFEAAPTVVLAVKPQGMRGIVTPLAGASVGKLVISIAAGVRLAQLEAWLGTDRAIVRAMPNTPALVLSGMTVLCPNAACGKKQVEKAREIFAAVGDVEVLQREDLLDAVTGLSGCGPGFLFEIMDALLEGGAKLGLPPALARRLVLQTFLGSAKLALETQRTPAVLRDQVASPGGATLAGLEALGQGRLRATLTAAVEAAARRSKEMSS
jgi:pyrroline-5-carboxylate reductase